MPVPQLPQPTLKVKVHRDALNWRNNKPDALRINWPFALPTDIDLDTVGLDEYLASMTNIEDPKVVKGGIKMLLSCFDISGVAEAPSLQQVLLEAYRQKVYTKLFGLPLFKASHMAQALKGGTSRG